ncbi:polysaccharide export protein [Anaeromyxobacter dehalogenans 2CP-1]|uniref:Polysaccharide export protein n=1 Tax=Anaeromyxobacter dehalogenans (strain ATCC BAA-258 / DSM 21875 / 2CP-1) TaxID=455488 RepID=B8JFB1_ANAD2|nr:polysaccharide biosynthesis/export family protein [Anaeromyxobacter dehalogenans]ACL66288.1 polysaccharide export protein [Anaeromyxobacter dehalogenans 2CP-1]
MIDPLAATARRRAGLALAAVAATALAACGPTGRYVRAEDLPPAPADAEYRVARGDVVGIRVWNQDNMSVERTRVREDGRVSMPFLQDVPAAGSTPTELSQRIQTQLKTYVVNPVVTVTVVEMQPLRVSVTGEVIRPGVYDLDRGAGVLSALAAAGSFTEFAHRDRVFVLRHGPAPGDAVTRIRFEYDALVRADRRSAGFRLQPGDVVVVE